MKLIALLLVAAVQADPPKADYPFKVSVTGTGRPMVLVPGFGCDGAVWDSTVAHFKDRYECHVLTLAGFAGVPPVKGDKPFFETTTDGITRYARDKRLADAVIVGHSLGATVALKAAAAAPERFSAVVLVDGFPCMGALFAPDSKPADWAKTAAERRDAIAEASPEAFRKDMRKMFGTMLAGEKLETAMGWLAKADRPTAARAMGELFAGDARPDVAKVRGPVLLVGAYNEGLKAYGAPPADEYEKRLTAQLAGAKDGRVAVHPDCKHFVMYDEPKWLFGQVEKAVGGK